MGGKKVFLVLSFNSPAQLTSLTQLFYSLSGTTYPINLKTGISSIVWTMSLFAISLLSHNLRDTLILRDNLKYKEDDTMKRNITLSLDGDLIRKVRVISARKMISVSQLLSNEVTRIIEENEGYEENRKLALSLLDTGYHLGGAITVMREELHER